MTFFHAWRSLTRTPIFMTAAILSLALGIGAVGSMFAIVYGVLLAPLPYGEPDQLVSVSLQSAERGWLGQPPAMYLTYEQLSQTLDEVALYRTGGVNTWTEGDGAGADSVVGTWVTASMMPLLQVSPLLGRSFTTDEEIRGGPDAVILSEHEWRTRFNGSPDVIGKTLMVNSVARQIVGVMPARFAFPTAATRLWLPAKNNDATTVGDFLYGGVARLSPGSTAEQAQRELSAVLPRMAELFPRLAKGGSTASWLDEVKPLPVVQALGDRFTENVAQTLWMLAAAAGLVLLVAWANVVNLMQIRTDGRQQDLALREALGASRLRVASHLLGESLLLSAIAGALALIATYFAVRTLVAFGPADIPRIAELGVGWPTIGFIGVATTLGVLVCAAVPTLRNRRASLAITLSDGARGQSAGKSRQRLRAGISVLQIAIALVVTIGSALLLRTAHQLSEVQPGFDPDKVITIRSQLPFARYDEAAGVAFYARLVERVSQLPAVQAAGLAWHVPFGSGEPITQAFQLDAGERTLPVNIVDEGYFAAMKIPLLAGRGFQRIEREQGADVIISQRAAATLFSDSSGRDVLGRTLTLASAGPTFTVIGVVGDVREQDLATAPQAMIYKPGAQRNMALVVRYSGSSDAAVAAVKQIFRDLDPTVAVFNIGTMNELVRASTARLSLTLTLMTAAAIMTLLLGAIGLYGVMAYMVALRTREFGIRMALGASPKRIARLVGMRGLALAASGVATGFLLYAMATPLLRPFLYGITAADPLTLIGATLVLGSAASLASWLPARRAARIAPAEALRAE